MILKSDDFLLFDMISNDFTIKKNRKLVFELIFFIILKK
ncbi:hypothetical protein FLBR109950_11600 [Flavobacterium branchiophilum]|uniref:Uncharacterized protein n=1 Tax=Flavobacterium branchiophilum TaxID=55197 RepID=A0A543G548_9FLAO|nr:hypothetical protein BC670_2129 [Flavobacterium branchiophilum]